MKITDPKIYVYCEEHSSDPSTLLLELERETHLKTLAPQMLSGRLQGRFLSMISHMLQATTILEIGTFTGYGTLCLAEGLSKDGKIYTIESNAELQFLTQKYFSLSPKSIQICPILGDALEVLKKWEKEKFDLVFIDGAKNQYADYYDLLFDHLHPGSILLVDNVLWSGKVLTDTEDEDTMHIRAFNQKIAIDPRVEQVMLPIRDGLTMLRVI